MANLRQQLEKNAKHHDRDVKIHSPRNTERLDIVLRTEHMAQAIGTLASVPPTTTQPVSGLLVSKDFSYTLLDPKDLRDFTGLETSEIRQKQRVRCEVGWELVKWHLEGMFGGVEDGVGKDGGKVMRVRFELFLSGVWVGGYGGVGLELIPSSAVCDDQVMGALDIKLSSSAEQRELTLEWVASSSNDMIADAALTLILGIDSSRASVKSACTFPFSPLSSPSSLFDLR